MTEDAGKSDGPARLPSRYTADDEDSRWRKMWLYHGGGGHVDDDGADPNEEVVGGLPPLPDELREEGKYNGRQPDCSGQRPQRREEQQEEQLRQRWHHPE